MRTLFDAGEGRMLTVDYDYEPADIALRSHGIQMEPDYAAIVEITAVMLEGVDVIDILSDDVMKDIEFEIRGGSQ
jgi:hypothetical protein